MIQKTMLVLTLLVKRPLFEHENRPSPGTSRWLIMNKNLELLLQLQELMLMRKAQEVVQTDANPKGTELLDQKINQVRHKISGNLLSEFDELFGKYSDAATPLVNRSCQGCHQEIPHNMAGKVNQSRDLVRCHNCGRFLYPLQHAPPYV